MGFRFRKSFKAGPFRMTVSKSGISTSFGIKGARVTKKANGNTMTTLSIPGTGISYVDEISNKKKTATNKNKRKNNFTMKNFSNLLKTILLWFFTIFFAISALAFLPAATGFIFLIITLFLVPIQKWQELINKVLVGKLKIIAIIVLIILGITFVPTTEIDENNVSPETTLSTIAKETTESTEKSMVEASVTTEPTIKTSVVTEPTEESIIVPVVIETESTTAPTTESTIAPTEDNNRNYVLNISTMKFHYPSCGSAKNIKEENKDYYYGTRDELIDNGYSPCGKCDP